MVQCTYLTFILYFNSSIIAPSYFFRRQQSCPERCSFGPSSGVRATVGRRRSSPALPSAPGRRSERETESVPHAARIRALSHSAGTVPASGRTRVPFRRSWIPTSGRTRIPSSGCRTWIPHTRCRTGIPPSRSTRLPFSRSAWLPSSWARIPIPGRPGIPASERNSSVPSAGRGARN